MKKLLIIAATILLTACGRDAYRSADYNILCAPDTGYAYYVDPGMGDTSFLRRSKQFDHICKQYEPEKTTQK